MPFPASDVDEAVLAPFTPIKAVETDFFHGEPVCPPQSHRRAEEALHQGIKILHHAWLLRPVLVADFGCVVRELERSVYHTPRELVTVRLEVAWSVSEDWVALFVPAQKSIKRRRVKDSIRNRGRT